MEKREQNKTNSFIFYAECQYLRQLVGKDTDFCQTKQNESSKSSKNYTYVYDIS